MRIEVNNAVTTVEIRLHLTVAALQRLVISRAEKATKSIDTSSIWDPGNILLSPDQKIFSGNGEDVQMTASSRLISNGELSRPDKNRGKNTVEAVDFSTSERTLLTCKQTLVTRTALIK